MFVTYFNHHRFCNTAPVLTEINRVGGGGGGIKKPKILIECMKVNQNLYLEEGVKLKSLPWEGYGYFLGE